MLFVRAFTLLPSYTSLGETCGTVHAASLDFGAAIQDPGEAAAEWAPPPSRLEPHPGQHHLEIRLDSCTINIFLANDSAVHGSVWYCGQGNSAISIHTAYRANTSGSIFNQQLAVGTLNPPAASREGRAALEVYERAPTPIRCTCLARNWRPRHPE